MGMDPFYSTQTTLERSPPPIKKDLPPPSGVPPPPPIPPKPNGKLNRQVREKSGFFASPLFFLTLNITFITVFFNKRDSLMGKCP